MVQDRRVATLFLIAGLSGAGKTMRAKELAAAGRALRLTLDERMIPLFREPVATQNNPLRSFAATPTHGKRPVIRRNVSVRQRSAAALRHQAPAAPAGRPDR